MLTVGTDFAYSNARRALRKEGVRKQGGLEEWVGGERVLSEEGAKKRKHTERRSGWERQGLVEDGCERKGGGTLMALELVGCFALKTLIFLGMICSYISCSGGGCALISQAPGMFCF
eukprot:jgi/Botrbrau1/476/Bobra.110_2s0113.1